MEILALKCTDLYMLMKIDHKAFKQFPKIIPTDMFSIIMKRIGAFSACDIFTRISKYL